MQGNSVLYCALFHPDSLPEALLCIFYKIDMHLQPAILRLLSNLLQIRLKLLNDFSYIGETDVHAVRVYQFRFLQLPLIVK